MTKRKALLDAISQMDEGVDFEVNGRSYFFDEFDDLCCLESGIVRVAGISVNDFATLCEIEARERA